MARLDGDVSLRKEMGKKDVRMMKRKQREIAQRIEERKSDQDKVSRRLFTLNTNEEGLRRVIGEKRKPLNLLQLALDKTSFANKAYQDRAINSCLVQDINCHKLNFQMLHGIRTKNLAAENKLLRMVKETKPLDSDERSLPSWEELDSRIYGLHHWWLRDQISSKNKERVISMKEVEAAREKAIGNAPVKARIWDSLGSKKFLQDNIKIFKEESENIRNKLLAVRVEIRRAKKELMGIQKDISSLQNQQVKVRVRLAFPAAKERVTSRFSER